MNLPNQITLARLIMAVLFVALLSQFDFRTTGTALIDVCFVIFVIAALTDWLDGYLARRTNQVTSLGRILDPFVDKVLACGAYVLYAGPNFMDHEAGRNVTLVAPWMVVVIIARELLVSSLRSFSESKGLAFGADLLGKIKTWMQMITAGGVMVLVAHGKPTEPYDRLTITIAILLGVTITITILSGLNYLHKARGILSAAR